MFKFRNLSTRNFNDIFSGLFFLIPGVGLLIGFGIVPICLALYMSLFRWRPVQGRFVGFANYEKAIGDLTCGIIFILGILGIIIALWMIFKNWKHLPTNKVYVLLSTLLSVIVLASIWRGLQLSYFVEAFQLNLDWALDLKSEMFLDRRGDVDQQLSLIMGHAKALYGSALMIFFALILLLGGITYKVKRNIFWRILGFIILYAVIQIISVNWTKMIATGDEDFLNSLINTVFYSIGTVTIQVSLGLLIAFSLYKRLKGFSAFRFVIFLPYVTPIVAMASVFSLIFGARESSLSNQVLSKFGMDPLRWISDTTPITEYIFGIELSGLIAGPSLGMITAIIFGIWSYTGYNAVILLAGLTAIPNDLYEAADLEGATAWQTFRYITMPLLTPVIFFLVITGLIGTFQAFTHIYVMLGNTVNETLHTGSIEIWSQIQLGKFGYSSSLAIILFVLIMLLTISQFTLFNHKQSYGD